jgi:hypothetical protein
LTNRGLSKLTNLTKLNFTTNIPIGFNNILTQIVDLKIKTNYSKIEISNKSLKNLINLTNLSIDGDIDISPKYIAKLTKLKTLIINNNTGILIHIDKLINLVKLKLNYTNNLSDIKFSKLINLKKMELKYIDNLSGIKFSELINLKKLKLCRIKFINTGDFINFNFDLHCIEYMFISNLKNLINLNSLIIYEEENLPDDLLINSINLQYLDIRKNLNLLNKNIFNFPNISIIKFYGSKTDIEQKLIELDVNTEKFKIMKYGNEWNISVIIKNK